MDKQTFDTALTRLLYEATAIIPRGSFPDRTEANHGWHDFELILWNKGEEIRQLLVTSGRKLSAGQADAVAAICKESNAGRGRQSFVLLLGKRAYASYAPMVASLLSDSDVAGQAIDTLYKMGAAGYSQDISPFLTHPMTWIRNAAKRYLTKYP